MQITIVNIAMIIVMHGTVSIMLNNNNNDENYKHDKNDDDCNFVF